MAKNRQAKNIEEGIHDLTIYKKVLDNVHEEIMLLDTDYRILWANKGVMDKYGSAKAGVISEPCYKVTHGIDHVCRPPHDICPIEEVMKDGGPVTVLHTHFNRNGDKIYAEVTSYPVYDNGRITEFIHISRDVTERVIAEERLKEHQKAIIELSTPVIEVWKGIIALPLIGIIDSSRARQIMENLLDVIVKTSASIAIIDITGVPIVDTEVADRLIKTIKAAMLLGTRCVMVGIKPEIAQSMVHLGVDLSGVSTFASLQSGLDYAFREMGLKVVPQ
ncbi:MAG: PAS domain-containing protein [Nitrospiraceae bacterium]|nr:PAS domain-containing protein [Nitrospiraceae bacterium]